jgi:hypothetical protein
MMTTFDQNDKTVIRLGEGGFGVVYLVQRKVDGQARSVADLKRGTPSTILNRSGVNSARIADTALLLNPCFSP